MREIPGVKPQIFGYVRVNLKTAKRQERSCRFFVRNFIFNIYIFSLKRS